MIIGLDVGGTHADVVLLNEAHLVNAVKVPTDPEDLITTVLTGLNEITAGVPAGAVERVVLSTTLTTNAVIQNRMAPVAMLVSAGPGLDPELFRVGERYHRVRGALDHRGREIVPVDPAEVTRLAEQLQTAGIEYVGVVGKFSVRNPAHELRIALALGDRFKKVYLGHQISGQLNFPRRIATTYLNAAVYPLHHSFFEAVHQSLRRKGLAVPIHVLKADGGTMDVASSMAFPDQTILSGPAASVMGATAFAALDEETLVLDIGGTTTDMALLIDRVPVLEPLGIRLGPLKTLIRALKTESIGVGGDSVVRLVGDKLRVGPERRGPALAHGGPEPTPTDACTVLGIAPGGDRQRAARGIGALARRMGMDLEPAARRILDHTCRQILQAAGEMVARINRKPVYTIHELREGHLANPRRILVLGGPAPYFAPRLEELSAYGVTPVPHWEVANAIGAALARTTCEVLLHVDTEQGVLVAAEENCRREVPPGFSAAQAEQTALELLRAKAIARGADPADLPLEIVEHQQFNMVRGFTTTGRNLRIRAQVKPGLIHGFEAVVNALGG